MRTRKTPDDMSRFTRANALFESVLGPPAGGTLTTELTVKIPLVGTIKAYTVDALVGLAQDKISEGGYGASDIGGRWQVLDCTGKHVGTLSYNGRYESAP